MYYEELVDHAHYQISYLGGADRDYFNCAHCLNVCDDEDLQTIEGFFKQRGACPAIYLDSANPDSYEDLLIKRGYSEIFEEAENWYGLDLSAFKPEQKPINGFEIKRVATPEQLDDFLRINQITNELPDDVVRRLKANLQNLKGGIEIDLFVGYFKGQPAAVAAIGYAGRFGFMAEAGTLEDYRGQGLYKAIIAARLNAAKKRNINFIFVNCDKDAFSNQGCLSTGFTFLEQRRFFKQEQAS
jgi:GNAT superfamily N-acetyltransferase